MSMVIKQTLAHSPSVSPDCRASYAVFMIELYFFQVFQNQLSERSLFTNLDVKYFVRACGRKKALRTGRLVNKKHLLT